MNQRVDSNQSERKANHGVYLSEYLTAPRTVKYEWLKRASLIKGIDHLAELCNEFEIWYNSWRPHMTLDGIRPDDVYYDNKPDKPKWDAKTVPCNIESHFFGQTRITGYRLKKVA